MTDEHDHEDQGLRFTWLARGPEAGEPPPPGLLLDAFVRAQKDALGQLRDLLEEGRLVSWADPVLELRFPCPVEWTPDGETPWRFPSSWLTAEKARPDLDALDARLAELDPDELPAFLFRLLTHGVAVEVQEGEEPRVRVPEDLRLALEEVSKGDPPETVQRLQTSLRRPFVIGNQTVGPADLPDAQASGESVTIVIQRGDERFTVSPLFAVFPLEVHPDLREAFFPVVVGLTFAPKVDPGTWPSADRLAFWENLVSGGGKWIQKDLRQAAAELEAKRATPATGGTGAFPRPVAAVLSPERRRLVPVVLPPDLAKGAQDATLEDQGKRLEATVDAALEALDKFEKDDPRWFETTLWNMVADAFSQLRDLLESGDTETVSWADPVVELHYPVRWTWTHSPEEPVRILYRSLSTEDLKDEETLRAAAEGLASDHLQTYIFQAITHGAVWEQREGLPPGPRLPEDLRLALEKAHPEVEDRRRAAEELFKPFILGDVKALGGDSQEDEVSVPEDKLSRRLRWKVERVRDRLRRKVRGVPFRFGFDLNGETFEGLPFYAVHPLEVYPDRQEAYYPIQVGLFFRPETDPRTWPAEELKGFWDGLLHGLRTWFREGPNWKKEEAQERPTGETPATGTTGETGALPPPPPGPPPVAVPPDPVRRKGTFPLAHGPAPVDGSAFELLRQLHKIRLPKKWSALKPWEELKDEEVRRRLDQEDEPFRSTPGRPAPLKRSYPGGKEVFSLSAEGERILKIREGLTKNGVRYTDPQNGREYLLRLVQVGSGYLEVGISWFGLAGPWFADWRKALEEDLKERNRQPDLFERLDPRRKEELDRRLSQLKAMDRGRLLMETILAQVGKQEGNPVQIPAVALRELLGLKADHWKTEVDAALETLRACEFRLDSFGQEKVKGYGSFLSAVIYRGAGPGDHGDGVYHVWVTPPFLGCLAVFASGVRKLSAGEVTRYNFGKPPTPEQKKALGWGRGRRAVQRFVNFDAGRPFYSAAEGLSPERQNLVAFIEEEETLNRDTANRKRKGVQVKKDPSAKEPRVYDSAFCPLLPPGKKYHAALGHFTRNAETGRTLAGTKTESSATGGGRPGGMLEVLGYSLPPGRAVHARRDVVKRALEDLKAVVEEYLKGTAAAKLGDAWLSLEEVSLRGEVALTRKARFYIFVPEDWKKARRRRWEKTTGWDSTESVEEARAAAAALREGRVLPAQEAGPPPLPLGVQLRNAREERDLRLGDVAKLFGVSRMMVSHWERGTEEDEDGRVRGKPISARLAPLVERWIQTREGPSPEELAAARRKPPVGKK